MNTLQDSAWQHNYLKGRELCAKGEFKEAVVAFKAAIKINPAHAATYHDLGVALHYEGNYQEALESFRKAAELDENLSAAWFNGGALLCSLRRFAEAIHWFRQAVKISPDFAEAHYNLGNIHKSCANTSEAVNHYRKAIRANPEFADAHNNLGTLLLGNDQLTQAVSCFEKALEIQPGHGKAAYNICLALKRMGRIGEALAFAMRAKKIAPQNGDIQALLVSLLQQTCDWKALPQAQEALENLTCRQLKSGQRPSEQPFLSFTRSPQPERNLQVARAWSQYYIRTAAGTDAFSFRDRFAPRRKITVGYLSEQFRNAATAHLLAGLFAHHDRRRFKIIAYSWGRDDGGYYRRKIAHDADHFIDIRHLTDSEAAKRIHHDKVDILVDLMGWMHGHRMGIPARQPAPVQVNFFGYPGTTGAPFIQYILADRMVIPPEQQPYYSEKVVYLPDCYLVNDPDPPVAGRLPDRAQCELPETDLVFCSFNTEYKITPRLFEIWLRILERVPRSVLWLFGRTPEARENLRRAALFRGVEPGRLVFAPTLSKDQHLARLKLADLALDTYPVNGHTTTVDALWAGVPVVTCQGTHFASRVASSILRAIGMHELVARQMVEYERTAIELALQPDALSAVKSKLKSNRLVYPLFDCERFARNLEAAYERMWHIFQSRGEPAPFAV